MKFHPKSQNTIAVFLTGLFLLSATPVAQAALIDQWRAEDLAVGLDDNDLIDSWTSLNAHAATAAGAARPTFKSNITPAGGPVARFNSNLLVAASNPVAGRSAFTVALVFKANAAGANDNAQWYGKTGLVDAEQPGVTADWGCVLDQNGKVGIGTGQGDLSTYATSAPSLVDGNFHVAVFTWGGGSQSVYLDHHPPTTAAGASVNPRNDAGVAFGGILTGQTNRRLDGDIAEIRFYDTALSPAQATDLVRQLTEEHIEGNKSIIRLFASDKTGILVGDTVTLSWITTNAATLAINNGVGTVVGDAGSVRVTPPVTTTYTLTATNPQGTRTADITVFVDPGIPVANGQYVVTTVNTPALVTLTGADTNGMVLTYSIVDPPSRGVLSGSLPHIRYAPATNFVGDDFFTFKVNDGANDSSVATVSLRVNALPTAPSGIALSTTNVNSTATSGSFLALLSSVDLNPEDTHSYALVPGLGADDNARCKIDENRLLAAASFQGLVGATLAIRLRTTDNTGRTFERSFHLRVVETTGAIVINEIHYNAPDNTVPEEFVELHNPTTASVNISFWRLSGGINYTFDSGTSIPAGGYIVVAQNPATLTSRFGALAHGPWTGQLNNDGDQVVLRNSADKRVDEVSYDTDFPWPIAADGDGGSLELVHPSLDNDLGSSWRTDLSSPGIPTPAARNRAYAVNAAPNIRQVEHTPKEPRSTNPIVITAKVTDPEGVASVTLQYQIVNPGNYIPAFLPLDIAQLNATPDAPPPPNPAFEDPANWTAVAMVDNGTVGDQTPTDDIYTVTLPQRPHRTLIRYRITVVDLLGASRRAPFPDDPSLNFACYVYDGTPAYQGHSAAVLDRLPIYTLISRAADIERCSAYSGSNQLAQTVDGNANEARFAFNWPGTLHYDGEVYDHIRYRLRGANGRYQPGKRNWRLRFNRGNYFRARDQDGRRYPTRWSSLNTGKGQSNRQTLTFGLNEIVNYYLWSKVGVPAPAAHFFHFRVIDDVQEAPSQYVGDFWGLAWAQENYDVRFLDAHNLPKGNLYKLINSKNSGAQQQRYQAPNAVTDGSDHDNIENNLTGFQSTAWLLAHVNYTNWYHYHAICEATRNYDFWPSANKNAGWYFEPIYTPENGFRGRMITLPWDSDSSWGPTWNAGHDVVYNGIFASSNTGGDSGQNPALQLEYRNVVRSVGDLLIQPDQINLIVDYFASRIAGFVPADLARWANAPSSTGNYSSMGAPGPGLVSLASYVNDLKTFMFIGGNWPGGAVGAGGQSAHMDTVASDSAIPNTPTLSYTGAPGFPIDRIFLQCSPFSDPQGNGTFDAIEWRVAEITNTNSPGYNSNDPPKIEWDAAWVSGTLETFNDTLNVPSFALQPGATYRARVRHRDNTGRWSHWSTPVRFTTVHADVLGDLQSSLVISEIMYHPPPAGGYTSDDLEWLELNNIGSTTLDLSGLFFASGIEFAFPNGTFLAPGQFLVLAREPLAFVNQYPGVPIGGDYDGRLDNGGETLSLQHPHGVEIVSFTYGDRAPWPVTPDQFGFSLVRDRTTGRYRASTQPGGSPHLEDPPSILPQVLVTEILPGSTPPAVDAIELFNPGPDSADLGGWFLTDDPTQPHKYRISDGTLLPANYYLVLDESHFNPVPGLGSSLSLSSAGEEVYLFSGNAATNLTGYSHGFGFGGSARDVTLGRYLNSVGEEQFPTQTTPTLGAENAGPAVGPVVISEIHYNPEPGGIEFIELHNISDNTAFLFDNVNAPANTWRLNGVGFDFPTDVRLEPNTFLLLTASNPATFRALYSVPAAVQIFGPYSGSLQNSGERIELQQPALADTTAPYFITVDGIRYDDNPPWPPAADGAGASLQRLNPSAYADDPINWDAAIPTPGGSLPAGLAPVITANPPNLVAVALSDAYLSVTASGTPPLHYQWFFNDDNISGANEPTLILSHVLPQNAGRYSVAVYNNAGSAASPDALVSVEIPAEITRHPGSLVVLPGTDITFTVEASSSSSLRYQWKRNGIDIFGETNSTLSLLDVQPADEGNYTVIITDAVGPIQSRVAQLVVLVSPAVIHPPVSTAVPAGGTLVLSIETDGTLPMGYRWRRGGSTVLSALLHSHVSFLVLTNFQASDAGAYTVVLTNQAFYRPGTLSPAATITLAIDTDGDGLPDAYENAHGLNPNDPADAGQDPDNDGMTTLEEHITGTDPNDFDSNFRIDRITANHDVEIRFNAVPGVTYSLESAPAVTGPWTLLTHIPARLDPTPVVIATPAPSPRPRFYRLVTPVQP